MRQTKVIRSGCVALLFASISCFAQATIQPPATADHLRFLSFLLERMGSIDHDARGKVHYEDSLVRQFGLNPQEVAVLRAAGQAHLLQCEIATCSLLESYRFKKNLVSRLAILAGDFRS